MAKILLESACSQEILLAELTNTLWDTSTKQIVTEIQIIQSGICKDFILDVGVPVDDYCIGSTRTIVTSDGGGGVNIVNITNSPNCCSLSVVGQEETGTNANTKKLVITVTGNASPYQIDFGGGLVALNTPPNQHVVDNIAAGSFTYNYTIQDANGCQAVGTTTINNQPVDCSGVTVTGGSSPATTGQTDGQVTISAFGGTAPYLFSFNGSAYTSTQNYTTGQGTFPIAVRDANDCEDSSTVIVTEMASTPPGMFDPDLIISDAIPFRFVLIKANPNEYVYDNDLFNTEEVFNANKYCFEQLLNLADTITIQISYNDTTYGTIPRLRIKNANDDTIITTLDFVQLGSGFYQIEELVPAAAQNLPIYFTIVSSDGTDLFEHARSEIVKVKDREDSLLIEYSNDSDYNNIKYEGNSYTNKLRIPIINFWEQSLEKEAEVFNLSESDLKLFQNTKKIRKLRVNFTPDYLHDRIILALSHDNVVINNVRYVHEADYEYSEYKILQRVKTAETVLIDQTYNKTTVIV